MNSEQSDFILAWGGGSISSQLRRAWPQMQRELDAHTGGATLPVGTVLQTTGPRERVVFHAGFHEPDAWLGGGEESLAQHLGGVRDCVEAVLERAARLGLRSVAFPLIGAGRFGLPLERVGETIFDCILYFARRAERPLTVMLYVLHARDVPRVAQHGTRALAAHLVGGRPLLSGDGGHGLVRALRTQVRSRADESLEAWGLLTFAEFALATDLAVASDDAGLSIAAVLGPCESRSGNCALTFGLVRDRLEFIAARGQWRIPKVRDRIAYVTSEDGLSAVQRLVRDRNDFAHHRAPRAASAIVDDVELLFGARALPEPWPDAEGVWLRTFDGQPALLHSVELSRSRATWLAPLTRQRFEAEAPGA